MHNVVAQSDLSAMNASPRPLSKGPAVVSTWRGVLLVEPDTTLLTAEVQLLTCSDYSVTPAFSQREIFALRERKAIALAILSYLLGPRILPAIAHSVRKQWPLARILILGRPGFALEDQLYDEQMEYPTDPGRMLEGLERLYKDSWNQRSNTIDWRGPLGCVHQTNAV